MKSYTRVLMICVFCWPLICIGSDESTSPEDNTNQLLEDFIRIQKDVPDTYRTHVSKFFLDRADYLNGVFQTLKTPTDLKLVITDSMSLAAYRAGEMVVPYKFMPAKGKPFVPNLSEALWDYHLALAYFDANMVFPQGQSKSWDTYYASYLLAKNIYAQHAAMDEASFLVQDNRNGDFLNLSTNQTYEVADQAKKKLIQLEAEFRKRGAIREVRYIDTYVGLFYSYFSPLFADLFVAILHQNPNMMSSLLGNSDLYDWLQDSIYRAFSPIPVAYLNNDQAAEKYTHFFAPIRAKIWEEITRDNKTKEDQLKALEKVFLRMQTTLANMLSKLDSKVAISGVQLGETTVALLASIGLNRRLLNDQMVTGQTASSSCNAYIDQLGAVVQQVPPPSQKN